MKAHRTKDGEHASEGSEQVFCYPEGTADALCVSAGASCQIDALRECGGVLAHPCKRILVSFLSHHQSLLEQYDMKVMHDLDEKYQEI